MYTCPYPLLFTPITLAGTQFRNRIFASPTGGQHTHYGNHPINELICYYERKAQGGAASVCIGDAVADGEHAQSNGSHICLDDISGKPHLNKLSGSTRAIIFALFADIRNPPLPVSVHSLAYCIE